jgi:hypothetical protein
MDKTMLLKMREEQDMTNSEIAAAIGCCDLTIRKLIGPMPEEMLKRKQRENGVRNAVNRSRKSSEVGYTVERKLQSFKQAEEEPRAILAIKKADVHLSGSFMHYCVSADGHCVDVETEQGNVLLCVPADKLGEFIDELQAIKNNIGDVKPMEFWG